MASSLIRRQTYSYSPYLRNLSDAMKPLPLHVQLNLYSLTSVWRDLRRFNSSCGASKFDLTDLSHPHTWYPNARRKKRNVIMHVGPTNSGKTYHALKQLESSTTGVYCGPLRLLAWEVAKRLNKANVPCNLITGQEREEIDGAKHKAVTVEMADITCEYQCAVIDEIQVECYERLLPLIPSKVPLGSFDNIQTGDCVVTFSRRQIYKLKKRIENGGKHLCSVVYGSLPPETRTRQATMFNDESSEFDVLVASDAIGMGLNLNILRIIFATLKKFDGICMRELTVPEIKQIAGRAGRYGSKFPFGEVTCIDAEDLPLLHSSLESPSPVLERAGLFPTFDLLSLYSRLHPTYSFHNILPPIHGVDHLMSGPFEHAPATKQASFLEQFLEKAKLSPNYFIANCEEMMKVAAVIDELPLVLRDKYLFCMSPVDMNDDISTQGLIQFAESYSKKGIVRLKEIFTPETLQVPKSQDELKELESVHKVLELYVWLSFRLEDSFPNRELASSQKAMCSLLIEEFLERLGWQKPRAKGLFERSTQRSYSSI
ncbi:ATP-dependent RNA helicase SUV3, mitochondrial isoform X5 [Magnolia sinica]|uniref:ATP-dependent RNA helicase SUV3, mitochondrial isoform X5 n=1 Tax=Magnolia sinica TaxID=86752 RepID=UPI00265ACA9E|nr:ATP-dependent RNA helicase SUV3, mitochondrial isoform X5 [Magnolia sinica]